ncbi:class I SAM-dependent methyltransferase [Caulobacter soli]|uniref:class I SAM-dependent methyltransferase n=1 Tax=Caulobacter soli TaxID=2708539 RepID=UPI0013EC8A07|nr:class I SAM-dependent methyltransferase [Caulobacter soli]
MGQKVKKPTYCSVAEMSVAGNAWDRTWGEALATSIDDALIPAVEWRRTEARGLSKVSAEQMTSVTLAKHGPSGRASPCGLFIPGSAIAGRRVVELGCGYGWLGRQLTPWTSRYLGIDASRLVLAVAKSTQRRGMRYGHISDEVVFRDLRGTFDTLVTHNTLFHLNRSHLTGALIRMRTLLRPGALATGEFCTIRPGSVAGVIYPSERKLDLKVPSCGYYFDQASFAAAVGAAGFDVLAFKPDSAGISCQALMKMK